MILTQLEGKVISDQWNTLRHEFQEASQELPPQIVQSYLVQDDSNREIWRILTIWRSREELDTYKAAVETPKGVLMFQAVGTQPTLSIYEVMVKSVLD